MGRTLPNFFKGEKRKILQWWLWALFVCFPNSQKLANEKKIEEIVGICVARVVFTNARLGLGSLLSFIQGKLQFLAKYSTRFSNGGLLLVAADRVDQLW